MKPHLTSNNQGRGITFDRDAPSASRSEATAQKSINGCAFDEAYNSRRPPCDLLKVAID
jgi:hypothetical protein